MLRVPRTLSVLAAVITIATACTSVPPEELSVPLTSTTTEAPRTTTTTTTTLPEIVDFTGALAIGGRDVLAVTDQDGATLRTSPDDIPGFATQPAWSRDGERVVSFLSQGNAAGNVTVVATDDTWVYPARRGYFFFSWSGDGRYIAALGPGPQGTTLDILTPEGELATDDSLDTRSFYLAWEPGGDDLVIHRDGALELVRDPLDLDTRESLGTPGQSFLAPAWIPGTREIVIVDEAEGGRLIRLDVDTGERVDLGPVGGEAGFTVSPDGSRLFLTHTGPNVALSDDITVAYDPVQDEVEAATEIVVLETGDRIGINDEVSLWAEWSPDGADVAFLQPNRSSVTWRVLGADGVLELGDTDLSGTFFRNYVFFAWQFVESPRIWSPAGDAIVYATGGAGPPSIVVHPLAGEPVDIGSGDVAFWAPELPGGATSPA